MDSVAFNFHPSFQSTSYRMVWEPGLRCSCGKPHRDRLGLRAEREDDLPAGLTPTVLTGVAASSKGEVPVKATHLKLTHCSQVAQIKQKEGHTERSPSYEGFAWGPKISVFPNWLPWFTRGGKHCPQCQKKGGQGGGERSC